MSIYFVKIHFFVQNQNFYKKKKKTKKSFEYAFKSDKSKNPQYRGTGFDQNYRGPRHNYNNWDRRDKRGHYHDPKQLLPKPRYKNPPKESCVLFLKHIPNLSKEEVDSFFSKYGEIANFTIQRKKPDAAFLTYYDIRSAIKCKDEVSKQKIKGKSIEIDYSYRPPVYSGHSPVETCSRVLLKKTSSESIPTPSEEEFRNLLKEYGEISNFESIDNGAYITFFDFRASRKMVAASPILIGNSFFSVEFSIENDEPMELLMPGSPGFDVRSPHKDNYDPYKRKDFRGYYDNQNSSYGFPNPNYGNQMSNQYNQANFMFQMPNQMNQMPNQMNLHDRNNPYFNQMNSFRSDYSQFSPNEYGASN